MSKQLKMYLFVAGFFIIWLGAVSVWASLLVRSLAGQI